MTNHQQPNQLRAAMLTELLWQVRHSALQMSMAIDAISTFTNEPLHEARKNAWAASVQANDIVARAIAALETEVHGE